WCSVVRFVAAPGFRRITHAGYSDANKQDGLCESWAYTCSQRDSLAVRSSGKSSSLDSDIKCHYLHDSQECGSGEAGSARALEN
ncbi:MAG: hypothetical protein ACO3F0_03715, partial [Ilumatobacteraceae bacterium]